MKELPTPTLSDDMEVLAQDLSVLGRRRELTAGEEEILQQFLATRPEERWLQEAARHFEQAGAGSDDAALLDRVVGGALHARVNQGKATRIKRWVRVVAGAGVLIAGASAAAAVSLLGDEASVTVPPPVVQPASPATLNVREAPAGLPSVADVAPAPEAPHEKSAPRPEPTAARNIISAAKLLAEANDHRRQGRTANAVSSYRRLQTLFPASREASVSHLSLGELLLRSGKPSAALGEFERYLKRAPSGALAAEAWYGKARALGALSRTREERQAWEVLLERFPRSAYATAARKHLNTTGR